METETKKTETVKKETVKRVARKLLTSGVFSIGYKDSEIESYNGENVVVFFCLATDKNGKSFKFNATKNQIDKFGISFDVPMYLEFEERIKDVTGYEDGEGNWVLDQTDSPAISDAKVANYAQVRAFNTSIDVYSADSAKAQSRIDLLDKTANFDEDRFARLKVLMSL